MKNNLDKRIDNLPQAIFINIAKIDELKGRWVGGANLSPQLLDRLKRSALVTSTGASTRIEGSKLSDIEVDKLMRGLTIQKLLDRDEQEVRGYYELLQLVFDNYTGIPLSESSILSFHSQLLKYSSKDERHMGRYKNLENKVEMIDQSGKALGVLFDTTSAYLTPKAMRELIEWFNRDYRHSTNHHPLIHMANFIVEFLKIHPFQDGNGRLSRVLTNLILLQAGYEYVPYVSHEKLIEESKADYYIALRKSQITFGTTEESVVAWVEYFIGILLEQAERAVTLLSGQEIEKLLSPQQLKVWVYLGEVEEATPGQISDATGVARATVSQAISRLTEMKKVERIGLGSTTRYRRL
jgi:Fic family protein